MTDKAGGSVLIVILWAVFFLSALALAIQGYIRPRLNLGGNIFRKTKLHYYAEAGVKYAMLALEKDDTELYDCLDDTWAKDAAGLEEREIDGGTFTVALVDEERKININKASYDVLKRFFEKVGELSSQEAEDLADSIIDWRDEDDDPRQNGAEDGYYSIRHPGYDCKNGNFELLEELLLVKGMTPEVLDKTRDYITVYGEGAVNINTVDSIILQCLGMDEELAEKIIDFRENVTGDAESSRIFEDPGDILSNLQDADIKLSTEEINQINKIVARGGFCVISNNFMGHSIGKLEERSNSTEITFVYNRSDRRILYWREN